MSDRRKRVLQLSVPLLAVMVLAVPSDSLAERRKPQAGVTGGARLWPSTSGNERASRRVRHARDYSWDLYRYARSAKTIQPAVAKSESEELGRNIAQARQELATAKSELGGDPTTTTTLKKIDQHLGIAEKQHQLLHKECCKESVDATACMQHCSQILLELDRAQAEHDALMRAKEIEMENAAKEAATAQEPN